MMVTVKQRGWLDGYSPTTVSVVLQNGAHLRIVIDRTKQAPEPNIELEMWRSDPDPPNAEII